MSLSYETIFQDVPLSWGNKYPRESTLLEVWRRDPDYLRWACNLQGGKARNKFEPPALQKNLVQIANLLSSGEEAAAEKLFSEFNYWRDLSQEGIGLENLPKPSREDALESIKSANKLVGHFDLDGVLSLALLISQGALAQIDQDKRIEHVCLIQYGLPSLEIYSKAIGLSEHDKVVIVDFAAHPAAEFTFDHHSTSLSYWELGTPVPRGVFDVSRPSCPGLIADHCGFSVPPDIIQGCDMIDGARYPNVEATSDLKNPFVALNMALSVDVSDRLGREMVFMLANNGLRPETVLEIPSWQARIELIRHQLDEQRRYWLTPKSIYSKHDLLAVADARNAPNSSTRFRYLPFEVEAVAQRPYLMTLRPSRRAGEVPFGISRNPFYDPEFFKRSPLDLGALCKRMGLSGGGRVEAAAAQISRPELQATIKQFQIEMEQSIK